MSYLQKVITLTQAQYDTLAGGGTVGTQTGLNNDYIYLTTDATTFSDISGTISPGQLPVMIGATSSTAGVKGVVPAPAAGDENKFLTGAGTWATVQSSSSGQSDHTYYVSGVAKARTQYNVTDESIDYVFL